MDDRNSLLMAFMAISDKYELFFYIYKMVAGAHFGCPKFTFDHIFLKFLTKWLPSAILHVRNSLSITFLAILDQYDFFIYFFYSLSIAFLAISDRYASLIFLFDKMAAGGHFGCPKFTFDHTSGHFRSMRNFICFEIFDKMAAIGHFGCPKFAFDRISGHFRSIRIFIFYFLQNGCRRPFWMSEIHFRSHFWPFQIDKQL